MKTIDLVGKQFHRWTVLSRDVNTKQGQAQWLCRCKCGTERVLKSIVIRRAISKSCGCYKLEGLKQRSTTHGHATGGLSPTYRTWVSMIQRCQDGKSKVCRKYYDKGIRVCKRWHKFENFLADMGERPPNTTLDRKNTTKNYSPSNCRWATSKQQARNKTNNRPMTLNGVTRILAEWAELLGIHPATLSDRLQNGWSDEDALATPVRPRRKL